MLKFRWMQILLFVVIAGLAAPQISSQLAGINALAAAGSLTAAQDQDKDHDKHKDKDKHKDGHKGDHRNYDESEFTEKDEVRQSYQLLSLIHI